MSNPYEIDHNVEPSQTIRRNRRPSMTSFFSNLNQIGNTSSQISPHALSTSVDIAAAERSLHDQLLHFLSTASSVNHEDFLRGLVSSLERDINQLPKAVPGVSQSYLDQLERVARKTLKKGDECKICGEEFLQDQHSLVVQLPCHPLHRFDLECVGPWLRLQGTCPLDRKNLEEDRKRRLEELSKSYQDENEDSYDEMYA